MLIQLHQIAIKFKTQKLWRKTKGKDQELLIFLRKEIKLPQEEGKNVKMNRTREVFRSLIWQSNQTEGSKSNLRAIFFNYFLNHFTD